MNLVCGRIYEVGLILRAGTRKNWHHRGAEMQHVTPVMLEYCGGSTVDDEGHHIGGGVWSHKNSDYFGVQFQNLPIAYITDPNKPRTKSRWSDEDVRQAARRFGRQWRTMLIEFEQIEDEEWDDANCRGCGKPIGVFGDDNACLNKECETGKRQREAIRQAHFNM